VGITLIKTEDPVRQNLANSKGETKEYLEEYLRRKDIHSFFYQQVKAEMNQNHSALIDCSRNSKST
jgi:hypothetical protein|tara:strand:+ start:1879 stop:2076 length:198 start_codon:yes stop_codon:yes gene_type:complete